MYVCVLSCPFKAQGFEKEHQRAALYPLGQPSALSSDEEPVCSADNFIKTCSVASAQPVDSSCRLAISPAGGSAAEKTLLIRNSAVPALQHGYVHHRPLSVGQIPNPAPISLSANPDTNWILEVSTLCSWISRIRCTNLKAVDIFKRSHQMKGNINYSAD